MKQSVKRHVKQRPYIVPVSGLVLGFVIVLAILIGGGGRPSQPSENHVVILYDQGKRQVLDTKAHTVGELVSRLPLNLIPEDVVEPSLTSEIVQDNYRINIYRARPVTVVDSGKKTITLTAQKSPRVVVHDSGLNLQAEDLATFSQGSLTENVIGEKVVVNRATPVAINLYGAQLTTYTQAKTIADFLKEKQIELQDGETVQPEEKTPITENMSVFVLRKGAKLINVEEEIPVPTEEVQDRSLTWGTTAVRQDGTKGRRVVTYHIQVEGDKEVSRTAIQTVVITQPVPKIVAVGAVGYSGSLDDWLYKLRVCETNDNYKANTGNGFYGAYQFLDSTWDSLNTGYDRADLAPPAVQDQAVIANTVRSKGGLASQHPGCYRKLGLSQFPPSNR